MCHSVTSPQEQGSLSVEEMSHNQGVLEGILAIEFPEEDMVDRSYRDQVRGQERTGQDRTGQDRKV